ncbi:MAG: hypothetical protein BWY78_01471 [Alphaproteobacteria bacterium ADurb.Bin438]|nr:MAG: hypothetical protein BWY78_01471 [Alphaproteobacteria bacterium ADurb.Bin438]
MHIALGVSYYKTYLPKNIVIKNYELSKKQAQFWEMFYKKGLGEFCYRNKVDISYLKFPYKEGLDNKDLPSFDNEKKIVIPVGGGKDSTVVLEAIKASKYKPRAISVGFPRPIKDTIDKSGLDNIVIERKISENIKDLKDALNGHVPISGIIAFILLCAGQIYDFNYVLMANEASANQGNTGDVNHQWSKSFEFEEAYNEYVSENIIKGFNYISFLRPLSELHIAKLFSTLTNYHDVFTSCNKAFKLDKEKRIDYWCASCDKCRFVFLILAVFMKKQDLVKIFKKNMLNDMDNLKGYEELTGLSGIKPFECVGEIGECVVAFNNLSNEWQEDFVVKNILIRNFAFVKLSLNESVTQL